MGVESFTTLAILETQQKGAEIWEKVNAQVEKFTGTMSKAAETTKTSSKVIDDSMLTTASGADAMDLAGARVEAATVKLADATKIQAEAEKALLEAQKEVAAASTDDAAAFAKQTAAADALTGAMTKTATASKALKDAEATQAGVADTLAAKEAAAAGVTEELGNKGSSAGTKLSAVASGMGKVGLGMVVASGLMVKSAGDFQNSTEHLVTDAGESQNQLAKVQSGMLKIAADTGTSSQDIVNGMYHIESSIPPMANATQRASIALNELQVASQGAKVGNADLDTTSKALVGSLTAYSSKGYTAVQMMNALIATTGAGDLKLQDLAGSMANVTAQAASAGIGFEQVGGAVATMTAQGFTADRATQDLSNTISNLQNPSLAASKEMQGLGLNVNDLSNNLGKRGLTGTLTILTQALANHTHGGQVFIDTLKSSQVAAANLKTAMAVLPKSLQDTAQGLLNGSVTAAEWNKATANLPVGQKNLATQFLQLAKSADSFNQLLKSGKPEAQTFNAALASMMGGSTALSTTLMLTGSHMSYFQAATDKVGQSLRSKSKDVENWDKIQGTFNQKMSQAKQSVESMGIAIGTALLPAVTKIANKVVEIVTPIAQWTETHQHLTAIILASVTGFMLFVGAVNLGVKVVKSITGAFSALGTVAKGIGKLLGLVSAENDAVAVSAEGATVATEGEAVATEASTVASEENVVATDAQAVSWLRIGVILAGTAIKLGVMKAAQIAQTVATWAATTATDAFNVAMAIATSPITLVIAAIVALVAGFIYLWTHCKGFRDFWIDAWHDIVGAVKDVVGWVEGHWRIIISIIGGPLGLAVALVTKYWKDIVKYFMDGVHAVEAVLNWFGSLPGKFEKWLTDARNAVMVKVHDIGKFFTDLPGNIMKAVSGFASLLINAGEDLVRGLIRGVENLGSDAINAVKNLGSSMLHGAESFFGIGSPSKLMADRIGKFIPQGIAKGISDNLDVIQAAAKKAGNVTVTATQAGVGGSLPLTSSAGSGGGNTIIDLRGSQMMTERDMDVLVNKLGRALAVRTLPSGGLRVAM